MRGHRSLVIYLEPGGFGGDQPLLATAGRWRQAVNWWIIRGPEELEPATERNVAAG